MKIVDLFSQQEVTNTISRINKLNPNAQALWGKMDVAQMLAHCSVAYDMALTDKYPTAGPIKTFIISLLAKNQVVGLKPYPKNGRTAPEFVVSDERDFEAEKQRLVSNIKEVFSLGSGHFDGKKSTSFGKLSTTEWNILFSKHLDHHLRQFGV